MYSASLSRTPLGWLIFSVVCVGQDRVGGKERKTSKGVVEIEAVLLPRFCIPQASLCQIVC